MLPPSRQQDARRPSGIVVLGVAHTLDGCGLAKARGHTRREFEQQLRGVLQDNGLRRGSVAVAYVGSQAEQIGAPVHGQKTTQQAGSLTLFFNISGVPASRVAALATTLGSPPTLQRLQRLLSTAGLDVTNVRLAATREGGITMPKVAAPAAGTASPPAALGGNPHPGKAQLKRLPHVGANGASAAAPAGKPLPTKAQLKRLPHVGVNGATAAVPAAESQPGQPQLKRLPHVGANGGGAVGKSQDGGHAGSGDGFAAALLAAVGGCLSCGGHMPHAAADGTTKPNTKSAAARQPVAVHANGKALANGRAHAAGSLASSKHGSRATPTLSDGGSIASSTARTASSGGRRSTTAAAASNGQKINGKGSDGMQGDAVKPRRRWLCGMGPGGNGLEKRQLPPALRPKRRRTAREQAAAAALLAAGRSVVDAEGAHLSVRVPGKPGGEEAGSRQAGSRPRSGASTPLRRAGNGGAAASVCRKSNPGETSAPRLATAQRAAAWQERRPPPPPSVPATPSNAADDAADDAAADYAIDNLQSTPGRDNNVSLQGCPSVAEVAAAEARAWAAAVAEALPEDPPPLPPAAATETAGSGHAADAADAADPDEPAGSAAAAPAQPQYLSAADRDAYPADTPMAHASSLSAPAGGFVAYLPLTSTQPDRQPSGTWPRGILKTGSSSADSLKGGFGGSIKGGSGASTPAASLAGSVAGDAADPEHSATGGEVHNEWEPRTPVASPARRSGASVGIKLVPMAVSSNDSTPRTDTLWLPSKDEAPPTPEGIVRRLTQDFEARTQKEGATAGWPLSYPLAQSPLRRSLDGSPVRFGLEHRRTL